MSSTTHNLIGNDSVVAFLRRAHERARLAHAYLFVGPAGVGKMTAARLFAAELLGGDPARHPDFSLIERERDPKTGQLHASIILDQVRVCTAALAGTPLLGGWKVCVLDGADRLQEAAANALLKTLEEPSARTLWLLLAEDDSGVYSTIRSRCQTLRFSRVPHGTIAAALQERGQTPDQAERLARLAAGRPGVALRFAAEAEALATHLDLRRALLDLHSQPLTARLALFERLMPAKTPFPEAAESARQVLALAGELVADALRLAHDGAPLIHADAADRLTAWSRAAGPAGLLAAGLALGRTRALVAANVSPRAALEAMALEF